MSMDGQTESEGGKAYRGQKEKSLFMNEKLDAIFDKETLVDLFIQRLKNVYRLSPDGERIYA